MAAAGLTLMTREGAVIRVLVEDYVASRILSQFAGGQLPPKLGSHNTPCLPPSPLWCLDTAQLFAVHTHSLEGLTPPGQVAVGYNPAAGRSGT